MRVGPPDSTAAGAADRTRGKLDREPSFEARAEGIKDDALLDRLLAIYERKYPGEIAKWRDRMRNGHADGSRILIRYTPV